MFFKIEDLGELHYFLGLEAIRTSSRIHLCQCIYASEMIADAGFLGAKPVSSLLVTTSDLYQQSSPPLHDIFAYRQLIDLLFT